MYQTVCGNSVVELTKNAQFSLNCIFVKTRQFLLGKKNWAPIYNFCAANYLKYNTAEYSIYRRIEVIERTLVHFFSLRTPSNLMYSCWTEHAYMKCKYRCVFCVYSFRFGCFFLSIPLSIVIVFCASEYRLHREAFEFRKRLLIFINPKLCKALFHPRWRCCQLLKQTALLSEC